MQGIKVLRSAVDQRVSRSVGVVSQYEMMHDGCVRIVIRTVT